MPGAVVSRAWDLLDELENGAKSTNRPAGFQLQMALGDQQAGNELVDELKELDVANMTPIEAINTLFRLQEQVKRDEE
jgi:DNA mismatch repair protein MutS